MSRDDRLQRWWAALVGGTALAVYLWTACRTVSVGDSGELTVALGTGGIAHPPGYPLYTILGYLWLKLTFFLPPALAANILSGLAAAGTAVVLFFLCERVRGRKVPAILSAGLALTYAFSSPVWSSATNAEVYSFAGLLYGAALYAVVAFHHRNSARRLATAAFFCGLTLTHHFSSGVIWAGLLAVILIHRRTISRRSLAVAATLLILPLTLYLYLYFRFDPALPVNWMEERSLMSLWRMVSGEIYQRFVGLPSPGDLMLFLRQVGQLLLTAFGPGLAVMAVPGIIVILWRRNHLAWIILLPAGLNLLMISTYHIPDYEGYLLPLPIAVPLLMLSAFDWLVDRFRLPAAATVALAVALALIPLAYNFARCDLHRFELARHYGADLLDSAPGGAILFLKSDNGAHPALYLHYTEGRRADIELYSTNSTLTRLRHRYGGGDFDHIVDSLTAATNRVWWGTEYIVNQGMIPCRGRPALAGLTYGPGRPEEDVRRLGDRLIRFATDSLPQLDLQGDLKAQQIFLEYQLWCLDQTIRTGRTLGLEQAMEGLRRWGRRLGEPQTCLAVAQFLRVRNLTDEGLGWIELAFATDPPSYARRDIYVTLASIRRQRGELDRAELALQQALELDPGYAPARYNLNLIKAEAATKVRDWPAAAAAFEALVQLEPGNPLPYYNLGVMYDRIPGAADRAVVAFKTFVQIAGNEYPEAIARARERIAILETAPKRP